MSVYYTNQTYEAYQHLMKHGVLRGNGSFVYEDFLSSYQWMIGQMGSRIGHDGSFPVWLWTEKPDLSDEAHFAKGTKAVCLTVEMPDEHVLLSDFEAWHFVLNDWFFPLTDEEEELFDLGKLCITKEQSWERIFNIGDQLVQGVTAVIRKEQVAKVEHFTAR